MPVPNELTAAAVPGATLASQTPDEVVRLPVRPNVRFFLVCYPADPGSWFPATIEGGDGIPEDHTGTWILPVLQREPCQPGLNLHRTRRKEEDASASWDNAHLHIRRKGGIVIDDRLGYCVGVDCRDPLTKREGKFYLDAWSTPRPVRMNQRLKFKFDRQRYWRWLLTLMLDGVIPPPDEDIVADLIASAAARVARRESQSDLPDGKREQLTAEAQARADWVASAAVPVVEEAGPKKVRRKRVDA